MLFLTPKTKVVSEEVNCPVYFWVYIGYVNQKEYSENSLNINALNNDAVDNFTVYRRGVVFYKDGTTNDESIAWNKTGITIEDQNIVFQYSIKKVSGNLLLILKDTESEKCLVYKNVTQTQFVSLMKNSLENIDVNAVINSDFTVCDKLDYAFIDDPEIIGEWVSVSFVNDINEFINDVVLPPDEMLLKKIRFYNNGKLVQYSAEGPFKNNESRWTNGLIIDPLGKTASKYIIKKANGETFLFYEWKSGDYTIRFEKPDYYVLKKVKPVMSTFQIVAIILIGLAALFAVVYFVGKKRGIRIINYKKINITGKRNVELDTVTSFILHNYNDPDLNMNVVSANVKMSSQKIPKIIKKGVKLSFPQYLNKIRITEAKRLLVDSDLTVIEIAMAVGYNNVTHFNRLFKSMEKISPNEYRGKNNNCKE